MGEKFLYISATDRSCMSYPLEIITLGYDEESLSYIVRLKVIINDVEYTTSPHSFMEFSVINLQRQLPQNIKIACCQTCRHGNFCPYGDHDNEIYCLLGYIPKDKSDVVCIFSHADSKIALPVNALLHWCEKYQEITDDYYTYNDWLCYFRDKVEGK